MGIRILLKQINLKIYTTLVKHPIVLSFNATQNCLGRRHWVEDYVFQVVNLLLFHMSYTIMPQQDLLIFGHTVYFAITNVSTYLLFNLKILTELFGKSKRLVSSIDITH